MATTVTHIVDPNNGAGTDYTSLAAWEAGEKGDLTGVRDEIAVAKCRCTGGTADTTAVTIDGWITSATQYIQIWTDTAESYRHNGAWQTGNKYRIEVANTDDEGGVIKNAEAYTRILGLQVYNTYSTAADANTRCVWDSGGNSRFGYLIIKGYPNGVYYPKGVVLTTSSVIYNSVIYDIIRTSTSRGTAVDRPAGISGTKAYNVTVHNCYYGFYNYDDGVSEANQMVVINCLTASCTDGFYAEWRWGTGSNYNASSLASDAPGANSRNSQTFTFVNEAGDDFHLASTDAGARDYGTSDPGSGLFSDDIDGETRSGSWDIGADEYVTPAATGKPYYYHANQ
jgi:hypothetical protein